MLQNQPKLYAFSNQNQIFLHIGSLICMICKILGLVSLFVLICPKGHNYTLSQKQIDFDAAYNKLAFSPDQKIMVTYSLSSKLALLYLGRTFNQPYQLQSDFFPAHIEIYSNKDYNSVLYGGKDGSLILYQVANQNVKPNEMPYIRVNGSVIDMAFSNNREFVAVACSDQNVYIIDGIGIDKILQVYNFGTDITAVDWAPNADVLLMAGGQNQNPKASRMLLHNIKANKTTEIPIHEAFPTDAKFSPDGKFIVRTSTNSSNVFIHSTANTSSVDLLFALGATSLRGISISSNTQYVSAIDSASNQLYSWEFNGQVLLKLLTQIQGTSMTSNGGNLLIKNIGKLSLYQLCPERTYYSASSDQCMKCSNVCAQCWGSTNYCLVCNSGYYFENQTCYECLPNCLSCDNAISCRGCLRGYYLNISKQCVKCADDLAGCAACETKDFCQNCLTSQYWHMNTTTRKCQCNEGYVYLKGQDRCVKCSAGCLQCNQALSCLTCNQNDHRIKQPANGTCLCSESNYQRANQCIPCLFGCKKCFSSYFCDACDLQNHIYQDDTGKCQCKEGYVKYSKTVDKRYVKQSKTVDKISSSTEFLGSLIQTVRSETQKHYKNQQPHPASVEHCEKQPHPASVEHCEKQPHPASVEHCEICSNLLPGCQSCTQIGKCLTCLQGFINSTNHPGLCQCSPQHELSPDNRQCLSKFNDSTLIYLFAIAGGIAAGVAFGIFLIYKFNRKKVIKRSSIMDSQHEYPDKDETACSPQEFN